MECRDSQKWSSETSCFNGVFRAQAESTVSKRAWGLLSYGFSLTTSLV